MPAKRTRKARKPAGEPAQRRGRQKEETDVDKYGYQNIALWEGDGEGRAPLLKGKITLTVEFVDAIFDKVEDGTLVVDEEYGTITLDVALWENDAAQSASSPDYKGNVSFQQPKRERRTRATSRRGRAAQDPTDYDEDEYEEVPPRRRRR